MRSRDLARVERYRCTARKWEERCVIYTTFLPIFRRVAVVTLDRFFSPNPLIHRSLLISNSITYWEIHETVKNLSTQFNPLYLLTRSNTITIYLVFRHIWFTWYVVDCLHKDHLFTHLVFFIFSFWKNFSLSFSRLFSFFLVKVFYNYCVMRYFTLAVDESFITVKCCRVGKCKWERGKYDFSELDVTHS